MSLLQAKYVLFLITLVFSQLLLSVQSAFALSLNPFERSLLAYTGNSFMDEQLISSCLNVYSKLRLFPLVEKRAIFMYRAIATLVLRGSTTEFALSRYDKLVIAAGSVSSTHGVPGLEHCFQLKTVADAQAIRRRVLGEYFSTPSSTRSCVVLQITSRWPHSHQPPKKSASSC